MSFCCDFLLTALVVFGLNSNGLGRRDVLKTRGLVRDIACVLFVHFFDLFHDLISLLLKKSNASRFILNGFLKLLDLLS
jgi:hypothetical protein